MMNRYKVSVLVEYHVTAESVDDAWEKIEKGAEFPVVPYDDETYYLNEQIISVIDLEEFKKEEG
jgi:hypothetical protein